MLNASQTRKPNDSSNERLMINKINTAINVRIKNAVIKMRIDTCSDVNIIDEVSFNKIINNVKLKKTSIKLYGYNSNTAIKLLGKFTEAIESKNKTSFKEAADR